MVPSASRRRLLQTVGATAAAALAGCSALESLDSDDSGAEYTLTVDSIDASPVEHALYEPNDGALFGDPARAARSAILPEGRHTTYGYEPLPEDAYLEHDGRYFQTKTLVTGRRSVERTLVRASPLPDGATVPDDAIRVDALDRPSARVVKILHSDIQSEGQSGSADLLRSGAYVLRRPAELESRLATGDLDGRVVVMKAGGPWNYRIETVARSITETEYATLALEVASSREQFRAVVFGSRIDAELAPATLTDGVRSTLDRAIGRGQYTERTPLSDSFDALLDRLGLAGVETAANGRLLWYDGSLYRHGLYVDDSPAA
ncbi:hypothetical protein [Haloarcula salina]|uniref:Uncharacterized protein n=1 Tax=Haloarcula salina TaxID=1429914 RepID=A0AA41G0Z2_9EURY|nr:hypothetical protein [Haloarcula salina]MBV0902387.1 hypothetical protein [Haloarcula salina]